MWSPTSGHTPHHWSWYKTTHLLNEHEKLGVNSYLDRAVLLLPDSATKRTNPLCRSSHTGQFGMPLVFVHDHSEASNAAENRSPVPSPAHPSPGMSSCTALPPGTWQPPSTPVPRQDGNATSSHSTKRYLDLWLLKNARTAPTAKSTLMSPAVPNKNELIYPAPGKQQALQPFLQDPRSHQMSPFSQWHCQHLGSSCPWVHSCPTRLLLSCHSRFYCCMMAPEFMDGDFPPVWNPHLDESPGKKWCLKITCENTVSSTHNTTHLFLYVHLELWKSTNPSPQNIKIQVKADLWRQTSLACAPPQRLAHWLQLIRKINLCSKQESVILQSVTSNHCRLMPSWIKSFQEAENHMN